MADLKAFLQRSKAEAAAKAARAPDVIERQVVEAKSAPKPRPQNSMAAFLSRSVSQGNPAAYAEIERIVNLPVVSEYPAADREALQRELVTAPYYDGFEGQPPFRMHDLQCDAILAYREYGCLLASIGVGWGKTLITLLIAAEAYKNGLLRSLLIVPPALITQLTKADIPWARQRVVLSGVPFIPISGSAARRRAIAKSGKRGCYVMASSMLSAPNGEEVLTTLAPQLVIADEAHHFRNLDKSARAKRLMRYFDAADPQAVWLSGTITSKSVVDYYHMAHTLGAQSPLPLRRNVALDWASVLDSGADLQETNTGPVKPLLAWASAQEDVPHCPANATGFRRAYMHRLATNPVVVSTGDAELAVSLVIEHVDVDPEGAPGSEILAQYRQDIEELWQAPNGDEIDFAFHKYRWLFELSAGIYNDRFWPAPDVLAKRRSIAEPDAEHLLEKAQEHHAYAQELAKQTRKWLANHEIPGLDSPMLLGGDMYRHGASNVGPDLYDAWVVVKTLAEATPGMPERDKRVVRVCDYKIKRAAAWAEQRKHGVIWYKNRGVGRWLAEEIPGAIHCPAGAKSDALLADMTKHTGRIVIAGIDAHGVGKNLWNHTNQLFVQWPREAAAAEQLLGRVHRHGQMADEITAEILCERPDKTPSFDEMLYAAMLNDALYIHQTTNNRQKTIYANYPTIPRVFPHSVLEERGFEMKLKLDRAQATALRERFARS